MSQKLGSSLLKQASERQISSLRWVPGAAFRNPWKPDPPCLSDFLLMTLSYVGSHVVAPGNIQPWRTPFPIWNQSVVPCPVLTVTSWPAYRFLRRQVSWFGICNLLRIFQVCCDPHKDFGIVNKTEVGVFLEVSFFFYDPRDIGIWSLVPLPFVNPACTSGISHFTYCWSLAWRILSIVMLACEMSTTVW